MWPSHNDLCNVWLDFSSDFSTTVWRGIVLAELTICWWDLIIGDVDKNMNNVGNPKDDLKNGSVLNKN